MIAAENPTAGQGAVVLDIGGDVGALILSMPEGTVGAEVEICPAGHRADVPDEGHGWWPGGWRGHSHEAGHSHAAGPAWPHVAVLPRPTAVGPRPAAVFPALRQGTYEVWLRPDGPTSLVAHVAGGFVTTATWR